MQYMNIYNIIIKIYTPAIVTFPKNTIIPENPDNVPTNAKLFIIYLYALTHAS